MWLKAELHSDGIHILWQVRTAILNGKVITFDFDNNPESETPCESFVYGDIYNDCGVIRTDEAFFEYFGMDDFEQLIAGIANHALVLILEGYGDSPDEVVDWFNDYENLFYLEDKRYLITEEYGIFKGLKGCYFDGYFDNGVYSLCLNMGNKEDAIKIEGKEMVKSFLIASIPQ